MKASQFATLSVKRKKKILESAAQGANVDQRQLMKRYESIVKRGTAHS